MALTYMDHYMGFEAQTCSYTAKFISDNAAKAKAAGQSEAQYRTSLIQGHMGFLSGKWYGEAWDAGKVIMRGKYGSGSAAGKLTYSWTSTGKVQQKAILGNQEFVEEFDWQTFDLFVTKALEDPNYTLSVPATRPPAVAQGSKSPGSLTDEDAAILFVKTKDEFAKAKGVNIQGANPQLDLEVFESVGKATGYTQNEIRLKVEAYKATGKKLSSLKKQVLAGKKTVKLPDLVEAEPKPVVSAPPVKSKTFKEIVEEAKEEELDWIDMIMVDADAVKKDFELVEHTFGETAGWKVMYKGHDAGALTEADFFDGYGSVVNYVLDPKDKDGKWLSPLGPYKSMTDAKAGAKAHAEATFAEAPDMVQPPPVHVAASQPAVKEAVADLKTKDANDALVFADEDLVKAYIKAKDVVAGDEANPYTLYSKGDDFDYLIRTQMKDALQTTKLTQQQVNTAIANYLGSGQKISVLKKKMISSGELKPTASSLKKTKAEKQFETPTTMSHAEAEKQINEMASAAAEPVGSGTRHVFNETQKDDIFNGLKNSIYAGGSPDSLYNYFYQQAIKWEKATSEKVSVLDIIRIYDAKKAKQLGIDNGNFYEKKIADWAATPNGQSKIYAVKNAAKIEAEKKAKAVAAEGLINADIPPLPADSVKFKAITNSEAKAMQNRAAPWNAEQKSGLRTYTTGSYTSMNGYQRGGSSYINDALRRDINAAQDGMRPVEQDIFIMRGCDYRQFGLTDDRAYSWDAALHLEVKSLVGKEIQDKAFTSASVARDNGSHASAFGGSVRLEIEVPKGTYGAFVDHISANQGENEFLMAAGTKYKVLQVTKQGSQTVVRVRAVPGSHRKTRI